MKNFFLVNLWNSMKREKYFSEFLIEKIENKLREWEKIILYLNRRWEYSSLICSDCQKIFYCKNCDVWMNIHHSSKMICHECWHSEYVPTACDSCWSVELKKVWVWTQQIEEKLNLFFPWKKIFRFDTDTVKNKWEKQKALDDLENADIIIWTKMITTGFNFENVGLIWVVLLEQELWIPDFETEERVYSNIKQVIWRWGRKWKETDIVVQTFIPENDIVKKITEKNYKEFFIDTLNERKLFSYPPYKEFVYITYRDKDKEKSYKFIKKFFGKLDWYKTSEDLLMLNEIPQKKNNQYVFSITLKSNNVRILLDKVKTEIFRTNNLQIVFK